MINKKPQNCGGVKGVQCGGMKGQPQNAATEKQLTDIKPKKK